MKDYKTDFRDSSDYTRSRIDQKLLCMGLILKIKSLTLHRVNRASLQGSRGIEFIDENGGDPGVRL
jgi:hypothetical protein